jgi:hypothetical protein
VGLAPVAFFLVVLAFGEAGGKKEKKVKEPKAKRANPFMMFSSANRADVLKKNPDATFGETGKILGDLWKKCSDKEKADWKKKAEVQTAKNLKEFNAKNKK